MLGLLASILVAQAPSPIVTCAAGERLMRARQAIDGGELEEVHCVAGGKAPVRGRDGGEVVERFTFVAGALDARMQRWVLRDGGAPVIVEDITRTDAGTLRWEKYDEQGRLASVRSRESIDGGAELLERISSFLENGVRGSTRASVVDATTPLVDLEPPPAPHEASWPDGCLSERNEVLDGGALETTFRPRSSCRRGGDAGVPVVMIDSATSRITEITGERATWPKELRHEGGNALSLAQARVLSICFGKTKICHDGVFPSSFSVAWSTQGRFAVVTATEKDGDNTVFDFQRKTHRSTASSRFAGPSELLFDDGKLLNPATGEIRKTACDATKFVRRLPDGSVLCARMNAQGEAEWTRERGAKSVTCTSLVRWRLSTSQPNVGPFAMQIDEAALAKCGEVLGELVVRVPGLDSLATPRP